MRSVSPSRSAAAATAKQIESLPPAEQAQLCAAILNQVTHKFTTGFTFSYGYTVALGEVFESFKIAFTGSVAQTASDNAP